MQETGFPFVMLAGRTRLVIFAVADSQSHIFIFRESSVLGTSFSFKMQLPHLLETPL